MLHLIFISSWMHVSIYLFLAPLYIHDMNNAVYVNQMAHQERGLKASVWKNQSSAQPPQHQLTLWLPRQDHS